MPRRDDKTARLQRAAFRGRASRDERFRAALYNPDGTLARISDARKPYGEAFEDAYRWSHAYGVRA